MVGDSEPPNNKNNSPKANKKSTLDANDESLRRYKESLGLGADNMSDPNDPRVCIILSLTMESPGRDAVTIDLSAAGSESTLKDKPFKIKEGAKFTMSANFKVQNEILSGLHYVQIVKRKGIKVSKDSEMIGSYPPNSKTTYTKKCKCEKPLGQECDKALTVVSLQISSPRGRGTIWYACPRPL